MNLSAPFIARPVATTLITLGIALAGVLGFELLPIAPLPQVDIPTIAVSASLPGASPDTMAATVATPLERALGSIAGVTEVTSRSSLGSTSITLQFDLNRDIDGAARDVQAALNAARTLLPTGMPSNPTYRKVNPAAAPVMIIALTSDTLSRGQMVDAASTVLAQRLSQVDGVGQVTVGGGALPAVRVALDPDKLAQKGIALDVVRAALIATNANRPKGSVEDGALSWQIGANDQARTAADYAPTLLSYVHGAPVRLRDVASVVDSVQDVRNAGLVNGKPAITLFVQKEPGANIIDTVQRVRALLPRLQSAIPQAIDVTVISDRTPTIRASLREVERAMAISVALVTLVVLLFLRRWRAALIPAVAVPVSLAGTFGVMYLCGFSLDNLSAMALTVATGFVVDDAIVVLENIMRHIERGLTPREAALRGAREIGFTVVSISLSLVAVFIPLLLMGGIVGRLFREFSVVLAAAVLVSMVVSLTTTPTMAAVLLPVRAATPQASGRLARWLGRWSTRLTRGYRSALRWTLRHQPLALLVLLAVVALNVHLYITIPKTFFPQQDTGVLMGFVQADQSSSFQTMQARVEKFVRLVADDPAVVNVTGSTGSNGGPGGGQRNSASFYITLKPLAERRVPIDAVVARLRAKLAHEPGASLFLVPVQDIRAGGRQSNAQYQYTLQADDLATLRAWEPRVRNALSQLPELTDVSTDQQDKGLQTSLVVDRDAAARLGITMATLDNTLNDAFGQRQVGVIYHPLNQYRVVMELAAPFLQGPETLRRLYITSSSGAQVPLSAFAHVETTNAPLAVNHQSGTPAATISFNLPQGVSLSAATVAIDRAMAQLGVPVALHGSFQGTANVFQQSLSSQPLLIGAALLVIYLVLGMLYESLVHPITILSTLPSAGVGALLALQLLHGEFSIIALIGVILLIGIVKKNAIMMIDFALSHLAAHAHRHGGPASAAAAIYRAASLRLRPILMTTVAALFGALPLALGHGDGAELRQPLGITIVGGLVLSQLLTLFTTPVVFVALDRLARWRQRLRRPQRPAGGTRHGLKALLLALIAGLGGCAVTRVPPPAPMAVAGPFKEAGTWQHVNGQAEVPQDWWRVFADPVLNDLEQRLVIGNQNLQAAAAAVANARAVAQASISARAPTLSAGLSATRSQTPATSNANAPALRGPVNSVSFTTTASWETDLWGRLAQARTAAQASLQASANDLAAARLSAQALLAQTYFSLRTADLQAALLARSVQAYERSLALTQVRHDGGVAPLTDVLQARTQLKAAQSQHADTVAQRQQLEHAVAVLLGVPPATLSISTTGSLPEPPATPELLPSTVLAHRPDIAAAQQRVAAAYAQIGVADAAFFPDLTLSASAGYRGTSLADLVSAPNLLWSLGPAITQAIFDGGERRLASAQARANADQATATYRQTVLTALQEVEDNLVLARQLQQESQWQREALEAALHNLQLTEAQYRAGTVSYLNVVTAQTAALTSESTGLAVHNRQLAAINQLLKNTAGRWTIPPL